MLRQSLESRVCHAESQANADELILGVITDFGAYIFGDYRV